MQVILNHIETVKEKPHHIRRQVAFAVAGGLAAFIGLVWLIGSLSLGAFAIKGSTFADAAGEGSFTPSEYGDGTSQLAGAAAARLNSAESARIEIVDVPAASKKSQQEQTIIPF